MKKTSWNQNAFSDGKDSSAESNKVEGGGDALFMDTSSNRGKNVRRK